MSDAVAEVKQRTDIVELVGSYVRLKKTGANHKGLCPFHQEKTPSFMVNAERQIYRCFGCGEGGDAIAFVQKMDGLTFREALERLAQKAGITLPEYRVAGPAAVEKKEQKSKLYALNGQASDFYKTVLHQTPYGQSALKYLTDRGVSKRMIELWGLGYAPKERDLLYRVFIKKGASVGDLLAAGLVVVDDQKQGAYRDRFIGRVVFPLRTPTGETVGFTGRILEDRPNAPKYLNTGETVLFRKSEYLYGLDQAKKAIREQKSLIVVEGHLDLLLAFQAGTTNIVATGGTAVTTDHLTIMKRLTDRLLLAFDSDQAGRKSRDEVALLALQRGLEVRVVNLGNYKDPGECAQVSAEDWCKRVTNADLFLDARLKEIEQSVMKGASGRLRGELAQSFLQLLVVPNAVEARHYQKRLAEVLEVSESSIADEARKFTKEKVSRSTHETAGKSRNMLLSMDELLVGLLIRFPALLEKMPVLPINDPELQEILAARGQAAQLSGTVKTRFDVLLFTLEELYGSMSQAEAKQEITALLKRKTTSSKEEIQAAFAKKIRAAEQSGDRKLLQTLLTQLQATLKPVELDKPSTQG